MEPYLYAGNNPIMFTDPTGMSKDGVETRYVGENGKTLLNTKDGSDDVIIVPKDKERDFKDFNAGYQNGNKGLYDSQSWNNNMKADILGFENLEEMDSYLGGYTTQWSRQNAIDFRQNPTTANFAAMAFSEAGSQWSDPEKLIMGASILVGGFSGGGKAAIKQETKLIGPAGDAGALVARQIPKNWTIKSAGKGAGTRFVDPSNVGNNVRVMRGNSNSPFVNSRTPYTVRYMNGAPVDRFKNQILNTTGKSQNKAPSLHVPINNFKF